MVMKHLAKPVLQRPHGHGKLYLLDLTQAYAVSQLWLELHLQLTWQRVWQLVWWHSTW